MVRVHRWGRLLAVWVCVFLLLGLSGCGDDSRKASDDVSCVNSYTPANLGPRLIINFGGQSNMLGNGLKVDLPTAYTSYGAPARNLQTPQGDIGYARRGGDFTNFPVYNSDMTWGSLLAFAGSAGFGAEMLCMADLANALRATKTFTALKYAWGGMGVGNDCIPTVWDGTYTGTPPYPWAHDAPGTDSWINYQEYSLGIYTRDYVQAGYVWVGCEDDAGNLTLATDYNVNAMILVNGSRYLTGNAGLQWMFYKPPTQLDRAFTAEVRASIDLLVGTPTSSGTGWVVNDTTKIGAFNIDDLATADPFSWSVGDAVHVNSEGQILLGQRAASGHLSMGFAGL